jgi:hypothetical protein
LFIEQSCEYLALSIWLVIDHLERSLKKGRGLFEVEKILMEVYKLHELKKRVFKEGLGLFEVERALKEDRGLFEVERIFYGSSLTTRVEKGFLRKALAYSRWKVL